MPRRIDHEQKAAILRSFFVKERRMPGYNEMLRLFGYRSKNSVHETLEKLVSKGYLRKQGRKISLAGPDKRGIRLLGSVQAGFPSPAEEHLVNTLKLEEFLIERPEATFMLTVTGDSMLEAGILPGDLVLVERGITPKSNDIVIAQVDGEWTMKYFVKDTTGVRLEPANRKYQAIRPKHSIEVAGVVRTVIRKYK